MFNTITASNDTVFFCASVGTSFCIFWIGASIWFFSIFVSSFSWCGGIWWSNDKDCCANAGPGWGQTKQHTANLRNLLEKPKRSMVPCGCPSAKAPAYGQELHPVGLASAR